MKKFTTKVRERKDGYLEATIPLNEVQLHGIKAGETLKIQIKEQESEVKTRKVREGSDTLEISLPKEDFKGVVSTGDVIEVRFEKGETIFERRKS